MKSQVQDNRNGTNKLSAKELAFQRKKREQRLKAKKLAQQQEASGEENEHFEDAQDQQHSETESEQEETQPVSNKKGKKKLSRSKSHHQSDEESTRTPFSQSFIDNRERQRSNNHPKMAPGTRSGRTPTMADKKRAASKRSGKTAKKNKGKQKRDSDGNVSDSDASTVSVASNHSLPKAKKDQIKELQEAKLEIYRLKKRKQLENSSNRKKPKGTASSTMDAEQNLVYNTAKTRLWKRCKFVATEEQLDGATSKVLEMLDLASFQGLTGTDLIDAQEQWIADNRNIVCTAINDWRNYVQSQLYNMCFLTIFPANRDAELPTPDELVKVLVRDGLNDDDDDQERMQHCLDFYWDEMLSKVAGHTNWGPGKRHHGCISDMRPGDNMDEELYVTPSDEAFLVLVWENCYKKWMYTIKQNRADEDVDPEAKEYQTPYTVPKGGVQRFGGWNKAGRKRYRALLKLVKDSKTKNENLKDIEEAALERLRIKHKCQEREEKQKAKKKSITEELDSDHEVDWM